VDETSLFLHRDASRLRDEQRTVLEKLHSSTELLADKTVLIVDDDVRNIFAMTSLLERHKMRVVSAENGREALERLRATPEVAVVLMDIMLPEMDGYETTRAIRRMAEYQSLPILALTAKAMKGDREKCIEAGASDYVAKPVESDHLLSMLRSWLYR
jgi:CheY-like chemotaxis protein